MPKITLPTTPSNIFHAAQANDEESVKFYVEERNVEIKTANMCGQTSAHVAAFNGNLNILRYLASKCPSIIHMQDRWNQTALHMAAENGSLEVVKFLVEECNADIHQHVCDLYFGNSVLHLAAEDGHLDVLKYFIEEKKMDANLRNSDGRPCAFIAAHVDQIHIIQFLVEGANADMTLIDNRQRNILHMLASFRNKSLRVPKYLLDERQIPINVDAQDEDGLTPINFACNYKRVELIKYLVGEKNASVSICDDVGRTPLHQASYVNNLELVQFLVEHGADPTVKDKENRTAIELTKNKEVADFLEIAIWKRNPEGSTQKTSIQPVPVHPQETTRSKYEEYYDRNPRLFHQGYNQNRGYRYDQSQGPSRGYQRGGSSRGGPPRGPSRDYNRPNSQSDYNIPYSQRDPPRDYGANSQQDYNKPHKRDSRSLPAFSLSNVKANPPKLSNITDVNQDGLDRMINITNPHFSNIFLLGSVGVPHFKRSIEFFPSAEKILENRIDPIAIESVNSVSCKEFKE